MISMVAAEKFPPGSVNDQRPHTVRVGMYPAGGQATKPRLLPDIGTGGAGVVVLYVQGVGSAPCGDVAGADLAQLGVEDP